MLIYFVEYDKGTEERVRGLEDLDEGSGGRLKAYIAELCVFNGVTDWDFVTSSFNIPGSMYEL